MKKVFDIFLSLIVLMSLSACKKGHSVLTFVSSGESTIFLEKEGEPLDISLEYSLNGKNWNPYTMGKTLGLLDGDELSFRAGEQGNNYFSFNDEDYYYFKISGRVAAKGNIMSLLDRDCARNSVPSFAFFNLFVDCSGLISAPDLPATELAEYCYTSMFAGSTALTEAPTLPASVMAEACYAGMFSGCTSLIEVPVLPATELADGCYRHMFSGCTSLAESPDLPATRLAPVCYEYMFAGCTSLTKSPDLPATELADMCYNCMFGGCTSLTKAPALPATRLAEYCYSSMFYNCTSLTKAPVLPATKMAEGCYSAMFFGCTNLNYVKALFTDEPSRYTTNNWFFYVDSKGTFVKSKDATWNIRGSSGIPEGWTVITE